MIAANASSNIDPWMSKMFCSGMSAQLADFFVAWRMSQLRRGSRCRALRSAAGAAARPSSTPPQFSDVDGPLTVDFYVDDRVTYSDRACYFAFVLRCSCAATLSFILASDFGFPHPVWASISGLIVSQEHLDETKSVVSWRLTGTVLGISCAVAAGSLLDTFAVGIAAQIACTVALCAMVAHRWPGLRVSMWTAPIVYLSHVSGIPLVDVGLSRGMEVLLGGLVGAILHWMTDVILLRLDLGRTSQVRS